MSVKKMFKRTKPNKKWTSGEIHLLLDYLQEAEEFEAPTARLFYRKFIERTGIVASWDILKFKVRHLKATYNKARSWRDSLDADIWDSDGIINIKEKLIKICPYFDRLDEVFGLGTQAEQLHIIDTDAVAEPVNTEEYSELSTDFETITTVPFVDEWAVCEPKHIVDSTPKPETNSVYGPLEASVSDPACRCEERFHSCASKSRRNSAHSLLEFQKERFNIQKLRCEMERKRSRLEERKFDEDIKIRKEELMIKKMAIEKDERLKILEIEKDERIAMFEISAKYKLNA